MVKRFQGGRIPFRWVDEPFVGTGEGTFEICLDRMEAVGRYPHTIMTPLQTVFLISSQTGSGDGLFTPAFTPNFA
jgi:hypothetical protein